MDVHPTKNGMYRYWPIPILTDINIWCFCGLPKTDRGYCCCVCCDCVCCFCYCCCCWHCCSYCFCCSSWFLPFRQVPFALFAQYGSDVKRRVSKESMWIEQMNRRWRFPMHGTHIHWKTFVFEHGIFQWKYTIQLGYIMVYPHGKLGAQESLRLKGCLAWCPGSMILAVALPVEWSGTKHRKKWTCASARLWRISKWPMKNGIIMGLSWDYLGIIMGLPWDYHGIIMGL